MRRLLPHWPALDTRALKYDEPVIISHMRSQTKKRRLILSRVHFIEQSFLKIKHFHLLVSVIQDIIQHNVQLPKILILGALRNLVVGDAYKFRNYSPEAFRQNRYPFVREQQDTPRVIRKSIPDAEKRQLFLLGIHLRVFAVTTVQGTAHAFPRRPGDDDCFAGRVGREHVCHVCNVPRGRGRRTKVVRGNQWHSSS